MSEKDSNNQDSNRRVCDRLDLNKKLLLELDNGVILVGHTRDISLRDVLLEAEVSPEVDLLGTAGTLFMIADDGQHSSGYACKVVRLIDTRIALELDKNVVAAFGQYITKELFKRSQD